MSGIDVRFYLSIFARRFPIFLTICLVVSAIGLATAYLLPPVFRAESRIMVESPQISTDLAPSGVPAEAANQFQLIHLQMMTRANLLALADKLNLYKERQLSEDDVVNDLRTRTSVDPVQLDASRSGGSALALAVSFKSHDPVLAANVVNEFVGLILQKDARLRTDHAVDTLQFFQQETTKLSANLGQLEEEIVQFKKDNQDSLPESLSFRRSQQMSQQDRLMQLDREEASLREVRAKLLQLFATTGRVGTADLSPEEQILQQLRRVLSEKRTVFAESSPSIVALQAQINALEKSIRSNTSALSDSKKVPSELNVQLLDIERRLVLISQDKASLRQSLADLTRSIAATPANETALNALERRYQSAQAQYNVAISKVSDAATRQKIALQSKGEKLTLLEAATPPQRPIGPKRFAIAVGGIAAGFGLGFGVIFLLELLNKSIRRPVELVSLLEIEPLATIPYIPTGDETVRSRVAPLLASSRQ